MESQPNQEGLMDTVEDQGHISSEPLAPDDTIAIRCRYCFHDGGDRHDGKKCCCREAPHKKTYVMNITDDDVLLGRGRCCNDHPGNRKFRQLIQMCKPKYQRLERATDKKKLRKAIVRFIQRMGGRFLKLERQGGDHDHPSHELLGRFYYIVTDITAREKVSQALREASHRTTSHAQNGVNHA